MKYIANTTENSISDSVTTQSTSPSSRRVPVPVRRTGLQDIARELKVSVSLVSKVLNNRLGTTGASAQMIEAINAKAQELNYQKNATATSLCDGRQNAIGVFIHRHGVAGSNITAAMVEGVSVSASKIKQRLVLQYYHTLAELNDILPIAHSNAVDGLILGGVPHPEIMQALREASRQNLPIVSIHDGPIHPDIPNIGINQVRIGYLATTHLLDKGCRRIAHVAQKDNRGRFDGYVQALADRGVAFDEALVFRCNTYTVESGVKAAEHWLSKGIQFDAVFGQSDQLITGVFKVLMRHGIKVPEQVRLIGVDESPFCDFFLVPLSSISQVDARRAELAVDALMNLINGQWVDHTYVDPVVHARESSI